MAATSYDSLLGYIRTEVPGVPHPLMIANINLCARDLCNLSSCWADWQEVTLHEGIDEYLLTLPTASATLRHVKHVMLDNKEIAPDSNQNIVRTKPWLLTNVGNISAYYMLSDMTIKVLPKPAAEDEGKILKVYVVYMPGLDATEMPSDLMDRNAETLINGAKANLMAMPGQPWSNPNLASFYLSKYTEGVTKARIELITDYGRADVVVRNKVFGR